MARPILISAGGTGGGVYPAVAVAEALRRINSATQLHFIGSIGGMERGIVPQNLFDVYREVYSGPLNGVGIIRAALSAIKIVIGTIQAWLAIGKIRPELLFLTGGWATFPAAIACWMRRIPIIIFLPDIEPALTIKLISKLASQIMVTTRESAGYFPSDANVVETGYPLRNEVMQAIREAALSHFELDPSRKTLLVFGGSRGARSINTALDAILLDLIAAGWQVVHVSGELDWPNVKAKAETLAADAQAYYHAYPYLHNEMGLALAAADLVVSRAGASILGEFPYFGLPAILVPYPFAWRYQKVNADWLALRGAAIRLDDEKLGTELLSTIHNLTPSQLETMRKAALLLRRTDAAGDIAQRLLEMSLK